MILELGNLQTFKQGIQRTRRLKTTITNQTSDGTDIFFFV